MREGAPRPQNPIAWRGDQFEDTGELVVADAKQEAGQGLSRLLPADGLIGQGLRVQFLITTNEIIGALHPAVLRALSYAEATEWARRHRLHLPDRRGYRLAELFACGREGTFNSYRGTAPGQGYGAWSPPDRSG